VDIQVSFQKERRPEGRLLFGFSPTLVARLLGGSCPSAIVGLIRPVIVDAIYCVVRSGRVAHIGVKRRKRITPLIADINPASAVPFVIYLVLIVAAVLHRTPNSVCARFPLPMSLADLSVIISDQTAARIDCAAI
jgi:hypothetical protein